MKIRRKISDIVAAVLFVVGVIVFASTRLSYSIGYDGDRTLRKATRIIEKRLSLLDGYAAKAFTQNSGEWLNLGKIPEDLVVYRYYNDTLQSWCNEFPIADDNIRPVVYLPFIANPRFSIVSPLSSLGEDYSFINMGAKWYLAKSVVKDDCRVIAGLEILDMQVRGSDNGINPQLHIGEEYSINPLPGSGGAVVEIKGAPRFEILRESLASSSSVNSTHLWLALALCIIAFFVFLSADRTCGRLLITLSGLGSVMLAVYFIGRTIRDKYTMFSPLLYAGNELLYSLSAVIIINLAILVFSVCLYMTRDAVFAHLRSRLSKLFFVTGEVLAIAGIIVYAYFAIRSIILDSGISLELYNPADLTPLCVIVYVSFISMLVSVPLLLQTSEPVIEILTGRKFDAFSITNRAIYSILIAGLFAGTVLSFGLKKEQNRLEVLSNRIAFDRDIALELRLRRVETQIANDIVISALSVLGNTASSIQSRINDSYFSRDAQNYNISVYVFNKDNNNRAAAVQYNNILKSGVSIADGSRFLFVKREGGRSYYVGIFLYLVEGNGMSRVLLKIEPNDTGGSKGYAGIFGITPPGRVTIPSGYSYAGYEDYSLKSYRGNYPYPTKMDSTVHRRVYEDGDKILKTNGYRHFITVVGGRELIVISRQDISVLSYFMSGMLIALLSFLSLSVVTIGRRREPIFAQSYYRARISGVLLISLVIVLVIMTLASVFFVYSRNSSNMQTVMSDQITYISSMIESGSSDMASISDRDRIDFHRLIEDVGNDTNADISIYSPSGRLLMSTTPIVFERQLLSERINGVAYAEIIYDHRRYSIIKEDVGRTHFHSMYAPIVGDDGQIKAIVCSPYNDDSYDFEEEALTHSMTIVSLFLTLLLLALFVASRVVDRMFRPLSEMSQKMSSAGAGSLDYIEYNGDDEISSIIQAYNRMVKELSESTKKLASAERDKAWSEMARQVAHEIKNPLTPMKLQIQRVLRLKQKNDPMWQERFEEAAKVLLDHIDILTDTANEFSTFAKLYTEEPTEINLDKVIQEEIAMFDNKDNIVFDYFGLEGTVVQGPKPQLTRVFVNLINNSVQAIDEKPDGHVVVSLRNSVKDGFYDIVFEDNGPGVSEENEQKLFTPNFTTKSGGSGLGLAISRSILERCGATIAYSRSFSLGGACFTISYPREGVFFVAPSTSDDSKSEQDNR